MSYFIVLSNATKMGDQAGVSGITSEAALKDRMAYLLDQNGAQASDYIIIEGEVREFKKEIVVTLEEQS